MTWIASLLLGIPGMFNALMGYLNKAQDTTLEKYRVGITSGKEVSIAVVQAQAAGVQAQKEFNIIGMGHPIWWVAWGLYVIPAGLHSAAVHFVSTFHLAWVVDKLPAVFIAQDQIMILSIFGAQVTTGLTQTIANAWMRK